MIAIAIHSKTEEPMVVYKGLYGEEDIWCRPVSMWNDIVYKDGQAYQRFEKIA